MTKLSLQEKPPHYKSQNNPLASGRDSFLSLSCVQNYKEASTARNLKTPLIFLFFFFPLTDYTYIYIYIERMREIGKFYG